MLFVGLVAPEADMYYIFAFDIHIQIIVVKSKTHPVATVAPVFVIVIIWICLKVLFTTSFTRNIVVFCATVKANKKATFTLTARLGKDFCGFATTGTGERHFEWWGTYDIKQVSHQFFLNYLIGFVLYKHPMLLDFLPGTRGHIQRHQYRRM
jgi:hypothetical protein